MEARPRHRPPLPAALVVLLALALTLAACSGTTGGGVPAGSAPPAASTGGPGPAPGGLPAPGTGPLPRHPNVVLVLTDDLSNDLVPYLPAVQQLARDGTSLSSYLVADSLCCPSRTSLLTGQLPHTTAVFANTGVYGGFAANRRHGDDRSTIATDLRSAGYRTALLGKYLNGYLPLGSDGQRPDFIPPGWSDWAVGGDAYAEYDYDLATGKGIVHHGAQPQDYLTDVLADRAEGFLRDTARTHQPFFLEVSTFAPHSPFVPAPRDARAFPGLGAPRGPSFDVRSGPGAPTWLQGRAPRTAADIALLDRDFRRRAQSVQAVDRMLTRLRAVLQETGRAPDTYVVFTSDNGFHLGQHRLMAGKNTAFDTDVRVPFVVAGPGIAAGRTEGRLASEIDVRPTLDELAGVAATPAVEGRSLLPLLRDQPTPTWRVAVLFEHAGPVLDVTDPDLPMRGSGNPGRYDGIRTATETYVEYSDREREHYDHRTDPDELQPGLAGVPPARLAQLHATLVALEACRDGETCRAADVLPVG